MPKPLTREEALEMARDTRRGARADYFLVAMRLAEYLLHEEEDCRQQIEEIMSTIEGAPV